MQFSLDSIKIRPRLLGAFGLISLLTLVGGVLIYSGVRQAQWVVDHQSKQVLPAVQVVVALDEAKTAVQRSERSVLIPGISKDDADLMLDKMKKAFGRIDKACATYEGLDKSDEQKQAWAQTKQYLATWKPLVEQVTELAASGKLKQARNLSFGECSKAYWAVADSLDVLSEFNEKADAQSKARLSAAFAATIRTTLCIILAVILAGLGLGVVIAKSIYAPLEHLKQAFTRLSHGDVSVDIDSSGKDEVGDLARSANEMAGSVRGIVQSTNELAESGKQGLLDKRIDSKELQGAYNELAENMNALMDSIASPLAAMQAVLDKMCNNDFSATVDEDYPGVWNDLKTSLNVHGQRMNHAINVIFKMSHGDIGELEALSKLPQRNADDRLRPAVLGTMRTIKMLMDDVDMLIESAVEGRLDFRADASKHEGEFRRIIEGFNATLDAVVGPLSITANYIDRISKGDIPPKITEEYQGDFSTLTNNLNTCIDAVNALVADAGMLSTAAVEGRLETRADASKHQGDFRAIVDGVNETLDAVIGPLNMAADYVDRISKGDIPGKITDHYNGDFGTLKESLNKCIDGLGGLVEANASLQRMAVNDYTHRVEGQYQGIYAEVAEAVNGVHDRVSNIYVTVKAISEGDLSRLEVFRQIGNGTGKRSENDDLAPAFTRLMENIMAVLDDANMLCEAAVQGNLAVRADSSKHKGRYSDLIDGFNKTLNAVVTPVHEAARVLERLAANDLTARMDGDYKGDHAQIKESLNAAVTTLELTVKQVAGAATKVAGSAQNLSRTIDEIGKGAQEISGTIDQVAAGSREQSKVVQSGTASLQQLSRSIQEVAQGSQNQAAVVDQTVGLVQQISSAIDRVAQGAQDAAAASQQVNEVAAEGGQQVAEAVGSMDRIKTATDKVAEMVKQLGSSSQQIGAIVETIDDIAEQTNLLALNAAIEAARAGEHGKGFAVVADEVRKLAERSSKATGEIANLIGGIQQMTDQAVAAMEKGSTEVADGTELGNRAGEALARIQQAIADIVARIQQVSAASQEMTSSSAGVISAIESVSAITEESTAATEEMSATSSEVSTQMEQVAAVSQENAASAEEVSATFEQQGAALEEMAGDSNELANMARDLQGLVGQFKVGDAAQDSSTHRKAA